MLTATKLYDTSAALARIATVMEINDGRKPRDLMQADLEQMVSMAPIIEITFPELCSIVGIKEGLSWPPESVDQWFGMWRLINAAAKSSPKEVQVVWSFCCGVEPAIMMGMPEETIPLFREKLT